MDKWPVEQGWEFTVGLLGKVVGNKDLAWPLGCPGSLIPHQILCPTVWLDTQLSCGHLTSLHLSQSREFSHTVSMNASVLPVLRGQPHRLLCLAKSSDTCLCLHDHQTFLPEVKGMEEAHGEGKSFSFELWLAFKALCICDNFSHCPLEQLFRSWWCTEDRHWQGRHHLVTIKPQKYCHSFLKF